MKRVILVMGLLLAGCKRDDTHVLRAKPWTNTIPGTATSVGKTVDKQEQVVLLGWYDEKGYFHVVTGFHKDAYAGYERLVNGGGK